ncbi:MAG: hypothetical protein ABJL55_01845 [Roseibium sp.]
MAGDQGKKGFKSAGANKTLRSRGFLSQPGGQIAGQSAQSGQTGDTTFHHKSRGAKQVVVSRDGKPQGLAAKPAIRPYSLEDE